jgi:branched-chain amino acid transport system permease protein
LGSALLVWGGAELGQGLDYWRGVLGVLIMLVMVLAPSGLAGGLQQAAGLLQAFRQGHQRKGESA